MSDELDIMYTTTSPNGNISARQGRRAIYKNGSNYEEWVNTDGASTWVRTGGTTNRLWIIDGTETQLATADEIDMQSKAIINVTDPSSAQDAATKNYADGKISKTTAGEIAAMTEKTTLADADLFLIEDSAASNAKKKVQRSNIITDKNTSNVLFSHSAYLIGTGGTGEGALNSDGGSKAFVVYSSQNGGWVDFWKNRWIKIAGVSTLTLLVSSKAAPAGSSMQVKITIGALSTTVTINSTSYTDTSVTLDISSLTNGTEYTITLAMHNNSEPSTINAQSTQAFTILGS